LDILLESIRSPVSELAEHIKVDTRFVLFVVSQG
jgi:hypothetical protein